MATNGANTEGRALELLGKGLSTSVVASALGVTDATVSQFLAVPEFAAEVQSLRFASLQESTELDDTYTSMESKLLTKLENSMAFISKPRDILSAITVMNSAKRRGQTDPEQANADNKVAQLSIPAVISQKFTVNVFNQVTEVTDAQGKNSELVTIDSSSLSRAVSASKADKLRTLEHLPQERLGESSSSESEVTLAATL